MAKYRGKHPKSQDCVNAIKSPWMMYMIDVTQNCPHKISLRAGLMVEKQTCDTCEAYVKREVKQNG